MSWYQDVSARLASIEFQLQSVTPTLETQQWYYAASARLKSIDEQLQLVTATQATLIEKVETLEAEWHAAIQTFSQPTQDLDRSRGHAAQH